VDGLGIEAEEEAVVAADADAAAAIDFLEADDAAEGGGITGGEATEEGEGGAADVSWELGEGVVEAGRKVDEARGLGEGAEVGGEKGAGFPGFGGGVRVLRGGGGLGLAGFLEFGVGFLEVAAEGGAFLVVLVEVAFEGFDFGAEVLDDLGVGRGDGNGRGGGGRGELGELLLVLEFMVEVVDLGLELAGFGGLGVESGAGLAEFLGVFALVLHFLGIAAVEEVADGVFDGELELDAGLEE
jgi:hypothetical protein